MTEQVYFYVAVIGTLLMVISFLVSALGGEADTGEGDFDGEIAGVFDHVFSIKTATGFFIGFGLGGMKAIQDGTESTLPIAIAFGLLFVLAVALIMVSISMLKTSESVSLQTTLGREATVTVTIRKREQGLINVAVGSALREVTARSDEEFDIMSGETVIVKEIRSGGIIVRRRQV